MINIHKYSFSRLRSVGVLDGISLIPERILTPHRGIGTWSPNATQQQRCSQVWFGICDYLQFSYSIVLRPFKYIWAPDRHQMLCCVELLELAWVHLFWVYCFELFRSLSYSQLRPFTHPTSSRRNKQPLRGRERTTQLWNQFKMKCYHGVKNWIKGHQGTEIWQKF